MQRTKSKMFLVDSCIASSRFFNANLMVKNKQIFTDSYEWSSNESVIIITLSNFGTITTSTDPRKKFKKITFELIVLCKELSNATPIETGRNLVVISSRKFKCRPKSKLIELFGIVGLTVFWSNEQSRRFFNETFHHNYDLFKLQLVARSEEENWNWMSRWINRISTTSDCQDSTAGNKIGDSTGGNFQNIFKFSDLRL